MRHTFAVAAAGISGVAVFVNGYGVRAVPDATVYTTTKNLVAALVLAVAVAVAARRRTRDRRRLAPGEVVRLGTVAVVGGSVPFVLFFEGLARASSTHAAFVQKTLVVWVALLAVLTLGERLRTAHVAAMALIVGGLVALDGGLSGFRLGDGELFILLATWLWAAEAVIVKRFLGDIAPGSLAIARMGGGVVLLLGWLGVTGRLDALVHLDALGWRWSALTGVILAGYVATWYGALARAGAIDVTAVLSLGAVVTGVLGLVVKGTVIQPLGAVGMALLVTAAALIVATGALRRPAVST